MRLVQEGKVLNHSRGDDVALASGANRLMSKIRMSRLDRTRDAFDLVAASARP